MVQKLQNQKIITLLCACFISCVSMAQITISNETFPVVGDTLFTVTDTDPSISVGAEGGNQTWNFSSLAGPFVTETRFLDPSEGSAGAQFPQATMVSVAANQFETYYQSFNNKIIEIGRAGEIVPGFDLPARYLEEPTFRRAPLSFQDFNDDDAAISITLAGTEIPAELLEGVPFSLDSLRVTLDSDIESTVDAWGNLSLPDSNHEVIREKVVNVTTTKIFILTILGWTELEGALLEALGDFASFFGTTETTTYNFHGNDAKEILASVLLDEEGAPSAVTFKSEAVLDNINIVQPDVTDVIAYPNPTYGNVSIQMVNFPLDEYKLVVYNIVGKKLMTESFNLRSNRVYKTDLSHLSKGTYLYSIFDKNGKKIITKRVAIIGL